MTNNAKKIPPALSLTYESALELVGVLDPETCTKSETDGMTVWSGTHPEYGCLHVCVPAMGESVVLAAGTGDRITLPDAYQAQPFVIQDF